MVVGLVCLYGVRAIYRLVDDMYRSNVIAIVAVSDVRTAIIDDRLALNRSIFDPSQRTLAKKSADDKERLDAAWHR